MAKEKKFITCDGNEAAAHVSYMFSEVAAIYPIAVKKQDVMETFFVNTMWKDHTVNQGAKDDFYIVDDKLKFKICNALDVERKKFRQDTIYARYNTEVGKDNLIPLWLLGFLY